MRKPDVDPRIVRELASRALGGAVSLVIERTEQGVSTQVYRIRRGAETFYFRVAETSEVGDLGPEALVHRALREQGVRVPEVIYYEPFAEALGRSFMITTEIAGGPLGEARAATDVTAVLIEAGRDLAVVNGVAVAGFGWVRSDPAPAGLTAELPTLRAFVFASFEADLARLARGFLTAAEVHAIRALVARHDAWLDVERAHLAHGDFDVSHIYQHDGRYTGIIDFGEMRGADRRYDLGHYALHDGETLPDLTLSHLVAGYRRITPLSAVDDARIQLWSLLIGVRTLARVADRPATGYQRYLAGAVRRAIAALYA